MAGSRETATEARRALGARSLVLVASLAAMGCTDPAKGEHECSLDDADGVVGGSYVFEVSVDDSGYSPLVLKAQNDSEVTLRLTNGGTTAHSLVFDCLPTPNDNGCPPESCFPDEARVSAVEPGASASVNFVTPLPEGIYDFHSDVGDDTQTGQFIIQ